MPGALMLSDVASAGHLMQHQDKPVTFTVTLVQALLEHPLGSLRSWSGCASSAR
jgi:hypothetical protein